MSGIAAIFDTGNQPVNPAKLPAMVERLAVPAPDDTASWADGPVAMGHCTVHATAEGRSAAQPVASEDGRLRLVLDGYLANIDDLERELRQRDANLRGTSDAEIILHAYEVWGEDAPKHLEGEFAFILWDGRRQELFCARDHQGLRPLFYHWDGARLLLASDVTAIIAALPRMPQLNAGYLTELLRFELYTANETVWSGILRVPQAHWLRAGRGELERTRYWSLDTGRRLLYARDEEYAEHYRQILFDCVRRASRTDRPLAIEVSGGLDSTSLFCVAHALAGQGRLPAPEIRGYTMAGPRGTPADEIDYVRDVARELGVDVSEVPYFQPALDWFGADARHHLDTPLFPNGAISLTEEQAYTADGCRACINGVGGDQWLDGSTFYYRELSRAREWGELGRAMRADIAAMGWRWTMRQTLFKAAAPAAPMPVRRLIRTLRRQWREMTRGEDAGLNLTPQADEELRARKERYLATLPEDPHERLKWGKVEDPIWSLIYDLNSRQAAMNGISQRHPMLARAYIEFMAAIPEHKLQRGGSKKLLHREALKGILPDKVRLRTSEGTTDRVFSRHAEALASTLRSDWPQSAEALVSHDEITRLCGRYCNAAIDFEHVLALWMPYVISTMYGVYSAPAPLGRDKT